MLIMLTKSHLLEIERRMVEEHQKDREALERLKRFLPAGDAPPIVASNDDESAWPPSDSIIGKVTSVLKADPNQKWTVPDMLRQLRTENFPLAAKKPEATLGLIFKKLQRRGLVKLVRQGMGRMPSVYRWKVEAKEEAPEGGSKGEQATDRQPAHVH